MTLPESKDFSYLFSDETNARKPSPLKTCIHLFQDREFVLELESSEKNRDIFKHWNEFVVRYFKNDSDREELKNELSDYASAYESGWYEDEDSGDDDM